MKKAMLWVMAVVMVLSVIGCQSKSTAKKSAKWVKMTKTNCKTVKLGKGEMSVYDFGKVKLHAFKTNDLIADESFLIEKGGKVFMIESPCFFDNIDELTNYISEMGAEYIGTVIAYHGAGASFMPGKPVFSTKNADEYNHNGGGAGLVNNFAAAFGDAFDKSIYTTTDFIDGETFSLAGVDMRITVTGEAFDIEIPEINVVYTHMLGHDAHSIVGGAAHADALIAQLNGYIDNGIGLILTSHYPVEDLDDAKVKIAYLQDLKAIAAQCNNADTFKSAVLEKYGNYGGQNYLDMTAGMFYTK
ncbi:MAG: hypothetical protein II707_03195 [Spirochaetales bacterium]|nr:hypothetical protein [Spirochaetales bacterium]